MLPVEQKPHIFYKEDLTNIFFIYFFTQLKPR